MELWVYLFAFLFLNISTFSYTRTSAPESCTEEVFFFFSFLFSFRFASCRIVETIFFHVCDGGKGGGNENRNGGFKKTVHRRAWVEQLDLTILRVFWVFCFVLPI